MWTTTANQIIAELFWARQVIDHFDTLDEIQQGLFLDEDSEFPSIAADLRIAQAEHVTGRVDYVGILEGIFDILAVIPEIGEVFEVTAGALGIAQAATPEGGGDGPTVFDHTFAQMQQRIATLRQETQDSITAHRHHVLGDYGLLSTVGHLVSSQIWTLDKAAATSAGRQGFTLGVYRSFLPVLWDRWAVDSCDPNQGLSTSCYPPANGAGMNSYQSTGSGFDFDGLVPHQQPCGGFYKVCKWTSLQDQGYADTWVTVTGDVSAECSYDAAAGHSWRYGSCSLGVPVSALFHTPAEAAWPFKSYRCTANGIDVSPCVRAQPTSLVAGAALGGGDSSGRIALVLEQDVGDAVDLRGARVAFHKLLHEGGPGGAKELVSHPNGEDVLPRTLRVHRTATRHRAEFGSGGDGALQLRGAISFRQGVLRVTLRVTRLALDGPGLCAGGLNTSHLGGHLRIKDGQGQRIQILALAPWQCLTDRDGTMRLRYPPQPGRRVSLPAD